MFFRSLYNSSDELSTADLWSVQRAGDAGCARLNGFCLEKVSPAFSFVLPLFKYLFQKAGLVE